MKKIPCETFYSELANIYSWRQVAERTEKVYDYAMAKPTPSIISRVKSTLSWGPLVGLWALCFTMIEAIVLVLTEVFWPESEIDVARNFDTPGYNLDPQSFGSHDFKVSATE